MVVVTGRRYRAHLRAATLTDFSSANVDPDLLNRYNFVLVIAMQILARNGSCLSWP